MEQDVLTQCKKRVMRRVYMRYVMRKAREPVSLEVISLVALAGSSVFLFSVTNVLTNASSAHGFGGFITFFINAFFNTELVVKVMLIGFTCAFVLIMRRVVVETGKVAGNVYRRIA